MAKTNNSKRDGIPKGLKRGAPAVITPPVETQILMGVRAGMSINTASAYAGVPKSTVHDYIKNNPDFSDKIQTIRETPLSLALMTVYQALEAGDLETSKWYIEQCRKREIERERARLMRAQRLNLRGADTDIIPAVLDMNAIVVELDRSTLGE